ncbi:MAG: hypothetical protein ABI395_06250 [Sphingobium sp.]
MARFILTASQFSERAKIAAGCFGFVTKRAVYSATVAKSYGMKRCVWLKLDNSRLAIITMIDDGRLDAGRRREADG